MFHLDILAYVIDHKEVKLLPMITFWLDLLLLPWTGFLTIRSKTSLMKVLVSV